MATVCIAIMPLGICHQLAQRGPITAASEALHMSELACGQAFTPVF